MNSRQLSKESSSANKRPPAGFKPSEYSNQTPNFRSNHANISEMPAERKILEHSLNNSQRNHSKSRISDVTKRLSPWEGKQSDQSSHLERNMISNQTKQQIFKQIQLANATYQDKANISLNDRFI